MRAIWGDCKQQDEHTWELAAPRDAADGIGSALALIGPVPVRPGSLSITWELVERWGGTEAWRGFWLMFPASEGKLWPMAYYLPTESGWEEGLVGGPDPADQEIAATHSLSEGMGFRNELVLSAGDTGLALSRRVRSGPSTAPVWLTATLSRTQFEYTEHWPPLVAAYCEASRVRMKVT